MKAKSWMGRKSCLLSLWSVVGVVLFFILRYMMRTGWVVENDTLAQEIKKDVRVLCFVITHSQNLKTKAAAVKSTWAKRCNKYLFFSSASDLSLPVISLDISEGRHFLTAKTFHAFNYIYEHHFDDADWFFKADDDTYAIMENLRYLLSHYDPSEPVQIGYHLRQSLEQEYVSGGGGYVLSKEALRRFGVNGRNYPVCRHRGGTESVEDMRVGECLQNLGIKVGLSLDLLDRETFHPLNLSSHLNDRVPDWYKKNAKHGVRKGRECCSDFSITFHHMEPESMYMMDFLLYHMQVYGDIKGVPSESMFRK